MIAATNLSLIVSVSVIFSDEFFLREILMTSRASTRKSIFACVSCEMRET